MSTVSQLSEEVSEHLLDESDLYKVVVIDQVSSKTFEHTVKLANPFEFDMARFVPTDQVTGLPEFMTLAQQLIADAQDREGVVTSERVRLKEDFNVHEFQEHGDEVIAWRVLKREPANMNVKGRGRPQRRPLYDYDLRSPHHPNKVITVESRPIDHEIEFSCWAKTAQLANRRALWLERLFIDHSWVFKVKGVDRFHWIRRGPDTTMSTSTNRLYQRPLRFFARFREFHTVAHPAIRNLTFEVKTPNSI